MTPYLFWEFMILVVGVWLMVIVFVVYGWLLLKRQKQMLEQLLGQFSSEQLSALKMSTEPQMAPVHMEISKEEPISKYENFVPAEGVDVSLVDKDK